jgi:prepilin peptidase CpaA
MSNPIFALLLIPALPISVWVSWSDMKFMKIPNKASIALVIGFVLAGLIVFPMAEFGWRLLQGLFVLVAGFLLNAAGAVGGGDAKFAAAMAPFIALQDISFFVILLACMSIAAVVIHRVFGKIKPLRGFVEGWASWGKHGKFPFGLALAGSLASYLMVTLFFA